MQWDRIQEVVRDWGDKHETFDRTTRLYRMTEVDMEDLCRHLARTLGPEAASVTEEAA